MRHPIGPFSLQQLASAYGCSRQRLAQVSKRYGRPILLDPNRLAAKMLLQIFQRPPSARLVDALRDPDARQRIRTEIEHLMKS